LLYPHTVRADAHRHIHKFRGRLYSHICAVPAAAWSGYTIPSHTAAETVRISRFPQNEYAPAVSPPDIRHRRAFRPVDPLHPSLFPAAAQDCLKYEPHPAFLFSKTTLLYFY